MLERQHLWRRCWREDLSLAASPQPHPGPERPQPLVPSQPSWDWSLQPYLTVSSLEPYSSHHWPQSLAPSSTLSFLTEAGCWQPEKQKRCLGPSLRGGPLLHQCLASWGCAKSTDVSIGPSMLSRGRGQTRGQKARAK